MYNLLNQIFASILFIIFLPVKILISLFLLINIGRPIIFKQRRSGFKGRSFYLYKFRTMTINKNKNDLNRVYKSTLFLRNSRLDELPQLINIIKGDLNFVGPRPLLPEYNRLYNKTQIKRLDVMPGITGWAQVNGTNNISWSKKFKLDIWYVENKSVMFDLKIIYLTIVFILKKFMGNKDKNIIVKKFNGKN